MPVHATAPAVHAPASPRAAEIAAMISRLSRKLDRAEKALAADTAEAAKRPPYPEYHGVVRGYGRDVADSLRGMSDPLRARCLIRAALRAIVQRTVTVDPITGIVLSIR